MSAFMEADADHFAKHNSWILNYYRCKEPLLERGFQRVYGRTAPLMGIYRRADAPE